MATKLQYKHVMMILNSFIESLEKHGEVKGFAFSFSKRKIQIDKFRKDLDSSSGIIIKSEAVYLYGDMYDCSTCFKRYMSEEEHFQQECNNKIFCDEQMEDAITKAFNLYILHLNDGLQIGGYKRYAFHN